MANIDLQEVVAWTEKTKLKIVELDTSLEAQQAVHVLSRLANAYDISTWSTPLTTPALVRKCIAMLYVGWLYLRTYSEEDYGNTYATLLIADAELLLEGIAEGTISLEDVAEPNQNLAIGTASSEFGSGPVFTMDKVW